VEAVQPLVDRLGVAVEPPGEFGDAGAVPASGDDASALDPAGGRVAGSGELTQPALFGGVGGWSGVQECRHGVPQVPLRTRPRHTEPKPHTGFKERSTYGRLLATVVGRGV